MFSANESPPRGVMNRSFRHISCLHRCKIQLLPIPTARIQILDRTSSLQSPSVVAPDILSVLPRQYPRDDFQDHDEPDRAQGVQQEEHAEEYVLDFRVQTDASLFSSLSSFFHPHISQTQDAFFSAVHFFDPAFKVPFPGRRGPLQAQPGRQTTWELALCLPQRWFWHLRFDSHPRWR